MVTPAQRLTGPDTVVTLPPGGHTDWEVELVVIIGHRAEHVTEEQAWGHVAGLSVGQDISERISQLAGPAPQFSFGKSFPGFCPIGPWLVTPPASAERLPPAFAEVEDRRMVVWRTEKLICDLHWGFCAYYDLAADPGERRNLAAEPGQQGRIRDLHARMEAWFARYVTPAHDGLRARLDVGAGAW